MKLESREYKLLVNHEPFADPAEAVKAVWDEIEIGLRSGPLGGRGRVPFSTADFGLAQLAIYHFRRSHSKAEPC